MAVLRIRIELQRPLKGIELSKLSALAEESQKFLRMVAEDVGLNPNAGTWVAKDFYNQGIGFDAEYEMADVDYDQVSTYLHAIGSIATVERESKWVVKGVKPLTVLQSARLARLADVGETIRIGTFDIPDDYPDAPPVLHWQPLRKERAEAIIEYFMDWVEYRGMLQGRIHNLFKEANPPYFSLRDFASGDLVRCEFAEGIWSDLHKALERKTAVVLVAGWICAKRVDRSIAVVKVERIEGTKPLSRERLLKFFGSAPGWTGDLTTDQFIESIQEGDDVDE
jgi:hypothetical protein